MPDADYRVLKRQIVIDALRRSGFVDAIVEDVVAVAPGTRRRAVFKVSRRQGAVQIGFHAAKSHVIADMRECRVLTPALTALAAPLREMMEGLLGENETDELHITETENGFDITARWQRANTPALAARIASWAPRLKLARFISHGEVLVELRQPFVSIGKAQVRVPSEGFLQPTREGEAVLQEQVVRVLGGAKNIADLFAGVGTFALAIAPWSKVHAVESSAAALAALADAARRTAGLKPVTTEKRDLFKHPLSARELARFDAVVLDPPRAGAPEQIGSLAQSAIERIAYVSCNAQSFARDARMLVDRGYRMGPVLPVDQFLWSEHIELVASFARG
jgi:23S rRNA (uracil1939-C5)-methyltransferase